MTQLENDGHEGGESEPSLDLRHYWNVIKKRRWILLGTTIVIAAITVVMALRRPNVYAATATVVVDPTAPNVLGNSNAVVQLGSGGAWISTEYYNTQLDIINSQGLARRVVMAGGLIRDQRLRPPGAEGLSEDALVDAVATSVRARIRARVRKESRVFEISVRDTDPEVASELANLVARTYRDQNVEVKRDLTGEARTFVVQQMDIAKGTLDKSETALVQFKETNDILSVSLDDRKNLVTQALETFSTSLTETQKKRYEIQARRKAITLLLDSEALSSPSNLLADVTTLSELRTTYLEERRKLNGFNERYGPKHPEVIAQQARVDTSLADLKREGQSVLSSMDAEIKALKDLENSYKTEVERLTAESFKLASKERDYKDLSRASQAAEANYMQLSARLAESRLQEQDTANNISLLDDAIRPSSPVEPNVRLAAILGVGFGLMLGFGLAFFVEFLDRSVKSQQDVEQVIGLPFLGMVPSFEIASSDRERPELLISRQPNSTAAECCRVVRTNIMFSSPDRALRTFVVTSSNPVEGKTMSVVNLGIVMAQSGHRTLLVDTDMRRPRLHKALGISNENGVSRLVLGETDLASAVKSTEVPNLFLMPCGPHPPNPAELLQSDKFAAMAKMLGEKFDRVIFDSPPVLAVTDAAVLSRVVDGTILVVRAGQTTRDAVIRSKRAMSTVNPNIIGVVLNDVNLKNPQYDSYHHYYQYQSHEPPAVAEAGKSGG
jgi:succinoglycan biosynthesis transport protein ExoP